MTQSRLSHLVLCRFKRARALIIWKSIKKNQKDPLKVKHDRLPEYLLTVAAVSLLAQLAMQLAVRL